MTRRIDKPDTPADKQLQTCLDNNQNFIMIAGAGSGKTTSLVKALDYLKRTQGTIFKKKRQQIACITYTTVAEQEIKDDVGLNDLFYVSTIHGFFWKIIKPFQNEIKKWVSMRIDEKLNKLLEEQRNFTKRHKQTTIEKNARDITRYKAIQIDVSAIHSFNYEISSNYTKGILGHDDIIKIAPHLIKNYPLLRVIFAQKYPYLFIDESQDTIPEVVETMKSIAAHNGNKICLGFFGDEMQKIYLSGIGKVPLESEWIEIKKPENFRCPAKVLNVINNIRKPVDGLIQTRGRIKNIDGKNELIEGTARLYLFSSDTDRNAAISKVRKDLSELNNNDLWLSDKKEAELKLLVIEHRMAANRLEFPDLFSAFKDSAPSSLSENFTEGKTWALKPFQDYLLPLASYYESNNSFEMLELLRRHCPLLDKQNIISTNSQMDLLKSLKLTVKKLVSMLSKTNSYTIRDVLEFAQESKLLNIDNRLLDIMRGNSALSLSDEDLKETEKIEQSILKYLNCLASQTWGYQKYINEESPFSTQHSIKGAEFERVIVILDDEEGKRSTLYSYDKLFGLKPKSDTDKKNEAEGKETVLDRTRRLLYVCCSRATQDLAVIFFVSDINKATNQIKHSGLFEENSIKLLD